MVTFHPFEEGAARAGDILDDARERLSEIMARDARAGGSTHGLVVFPEPVGAVEVARRAGNYFLEQGINILVVRLATWCDDGLLLEMLAWLDQDMPVINWGSRDMNAGSLCGAQQFNMVLGEIGRPSKVFLELGNDSMEILARNILEPAHPRFMQRAPVPEKQTPGTHSPIQEPVEKCSPRDPLWKKVIQGLRHLKVGLLGARTQGMLEVAFSELDILEMFGTRVLSFEIAKVLERARNVSDDIARREFDAFKARYPSIQVRVPGDVLLSTFKNVVALGNLAREHDLGALSIQCYPDYMGVACLGFSVLSDEGITCTCEADVNSAVLGWIMQQLSRSPVNHVDLLDVDVESETITGAHCGSCSPAIAGQEPPSISHVRLAGDGACLLFPSKPGRILLAGLFGRKGTYRALVLEGDAIETGLVFPGNPVKIRLDCGSRAFLDLVSRYALGHHWIVAYQSTGVKEPGTVLSGILEDRGVRVVHP